MARAEIDAGKRPGLTRSESADIKALKPICRVLKAHDYKIAPSSYYAAKRRSSSARSRSDACLLQVMKRVYHTNYACYGIRKMWHELQRQGTCIGRDQVARLMRSAGLRGATRQRRVRTTIPAPAATLAPDLVRRRWSRDAPDVVWVSDF